MSDADIVKALRASIKFDAIHGTEMERAICGSQMIRAADEITSLRTELAAMRERVDEGRELLDEFFSKYPSGQNPWSEEFDARVDDYLAATRPIPTDTPKETGE